MSAPACPLIDNLTSKILAPTGPTHSPLARAVATAVLTLSSFTVQAQNADLIILAQANSQQALAQAELHDFNIAAGSLEQSLNLLGQQAGILLSFKTEQVADYRSQGLSSQYTLDQAQQKLLANTPLQLVRHRDGSYQVVKKSVSSDQSATQQLSVLEVTAQQYLQGTAADGYHVNNVENLGALDGRDLLNTPYSVHSLSSDLFNNIQAGTPADIQKFSPFVHINQRQTSGFSNFINIRGYTGDAWKQKFEDGMRASSLAMIAMEDKERMEVLNGLSGFLYGMGSPAGTVNYVLKRPTEETQHSLRVGNNGGEAYFVHADLSDSLTDDGRLKYRLNLAGQAGNTEVDNQEEERTLISAAVDYQVNDDLLLRFDASHHKYKVDAPNTIWQLIFTEHFDAPDTSKQWGQKWSYSKVETSKLGSDLDWQLSEQVKLRAGLAYSSTERDYMLSGNVFSPQIPFPGMYQPVALVVSPQNHYNTAGYLFADITTNLANTEHQLTLGLSGDHYKTTEHQDSSNLLYLSGLGSLQSPAYLAAPSQDELGVGNQPRMTSADGNNLNITLADSITFNDQWSAILGMTHSTIKQNTYANPVQNSAKQAYDKSELTPAISVIYKPKPWLSTYASYLEGLEQGSVAPIGSLNEGEIMSPVVSKQLELGVKAQVDQLMLTAAVFDMERANEFIDTDGYYKQEGKQTSQGIELSATGKVTEQLTVIAGLTKLDAKVKEASKHDPVEVAEELAKLYAEYSLQPWVKGLTLTAGAFYTGKTAVDSANTEYLPSYTTYDAGVRYQLEAGKTPVTLSLNVKNLTDEHYWLNSLYLGDPRTVTFAAKVNF